MWDLPMRCLVDLTYHNPNRRLLAEGPEITVSPVAARLLTRDDSE